MADVISKIEQFRTCNDIHQYKLILEAADLFISQFPDGIIEPGQLDVGIALLRELRNISIVTSLREYEYNYDLDRDIRNKTIKTFKLCIPASHKKLRGITELLLGMKEDSVG